MQGANAFIADKVFPIVNVTKQSDIYFMYSKADMFRDEVQERGRAAQQAETSISLIHIIAESMLSTMI